MQNVSNNHYLTPINFQALNTLNNDTPDDFLLELSVWEMAVPGEDRSVLAARIKEAYEKGHTELVIKDFDRITTLPGSLPQFFTKLTIQDCRSLKAVPDYLPGYSPASLTTLTIENCGSLRALPEHLPASLTTLTIENCGSLRALPENLPASLTTLIINDDIGTIKALPARLPTSLTLLDISSAALLALPEALPAALTVLRLSLCHSLESLPRVLPESLTELTVYGCHALHRLPERFPAPLIELYLMNCDEITILPELPTALTLLNINACRYLAVLPDLPDSLRQINLAKCRSLTILPENWPDALRELNISGCPSLTAQPVNLPIGVELIQLTLEDLSVDAADEAYDADHEGELSGVDEEDIIESPTLLVPHPHEYWYQKAEKTPEQIAALHLAWSTFQNEPYYPSFVTLLRRLTDDSLATKINAHDVVKVIDEVVQSAQARQSIFAESQSAEENCVDRPLTLFNTIQSLTRFSELQRHHAPVGDILNLAESMLKIALLDEATPLVMIKQWKEKRRAGDGNGPNMSESLEVQAELRHSLGEQLGLPFRINPLYANHIARLSLKDKEFVLNHVNATMRDNLGAKVEGLLATRMWAMYISNAMQTQIDEITTLYQNKLAALQEKMEKNMNEANYLNEINQLLRKRDEVIHHTLAVRTRELCIQAIENNQENDDIATLEVIRKARH